MSRTQHVRIVKKPGAHFLGGVKHKKAFYRKMERCLRVIITVVPADKGFSLLKTVVKMSTVVIWCYKIERRVLDME